MTDEINEIIKKNLPAQVGELLKQRLDQAESDAKELIRYKQADTDKAKIIRELEETIKEYKKQDDRNSKLELREKEVEQAERNRKVFEAELKLAEAEKRLADNTNFVGMVFKSPIFRKSTSESTSYSTYWSSAENKNIDTPSKYASEEKSMD